VEFGRGLPWLRSGGVHPRGRVSSCSESCVLCLSACIVCLCLWCLFCTGAPVPLFLTMIRLRIQEKKSLKQEDESSLISVKRALP
jgi:hypothetical protein